MREACKEQLSLSEPWPDLEHSDELRAISEVLDQHPKLYELAHQDLKQASGAKHNSGARGLTAEQVIRALLVKQINGFSYRELAFHLADSRSYSVFCRLEITDRAPSKSTLCTTIKALQPETLEQIHRIIVSAAIEAGVDRAERVRVDTTVVKSNIHHPTDSELLWDCVPVATRLIQRARTILGRDVVVFSSRLRRAKKRRKEINGARFMEKRMRPYRDLIAIASEVRHHAQAVRELLDENRQTDPKALARIAAELDRFMPLCSQVIDQAQRRIFRGESVPASAKLVSLFEPHTSIIRKDARDTLYGHKICLAAGSSSLVLDCQILQGNPTTPRSPSTRLNGW